MEYSDVKITDLPQLQSIQDDDLFLVSHPLQTAGQESPYVSEAISGGALSSTIKDTIRKGDLTITGKWNFHTLKDNVPTQDVKLGISSFMDAIGDSNKLTSIISDNDTAGWYYKLPSSILQKDGRSGTIDSLSVSNNSIPNIDFVERLIAWTYQKMLNEIRDVFTSSTPYIPSHVGQIVISTKLSHNDDDFNSTNIRTYYGHGQFENGIQYPDTQWIRHTRCFLRGASENVVAGTNGQRQPDDTWLNNAGGGADQREYDIVNPVNIKSMRGGDISSPLQKITIDNRPLYKNVYIWERVS